MRGIPQCKWCKRCKWCTHMIVIVVDEKVYPSVNDVNAVNGVRMCVVVKDDTGGERCTPSVNGEISVRMW